MERITVFTPTYNRRKSLPRVFESLKRQTFRDFIWIIVDDGSTDDTKSLVVEFEKEAEAGIDSYEAILYGAQDHRYGSTPALSQ